MAGGKETTRQKMIGMMYLVLTALLALNVSKEIVNAFVTLDSKINEGKDAFIGKANESYNMISRKKADYIGNDIPDIVKFWENKSIKLMKLSDNMTNYLLDVKREMLKDADGIDYFEKDKKGNIVPKINPENNEPYTLADVNKKDQYDVPTHLIGNNKGTPGYKKGQEIWNRYHLYRDSVLNLISQYQANQFDTKNIMKDIFIESFTPKDSASRKNFNDRLDNALMSCSKDDRIPLKAIYSNLTLPKKVNNDGKLFDWNIGTFYHSPIVAASALLSSMVSDVKKGEALAAAFIVSKIEAPTFNFNKIESLPYARTSYVNVGDELKVKVMLAAYDSNFNAQLKYGYSKGGYGPTINQENDGFSVNTGSVGAHTIYGQLSYEERGEVKWKEFEFNYSVGKPSAAIALPELNILYTGYDNKVMATASGFDSKDVKVSCSGCTSFSPSGGGNYTAKVGGGGEATITVSAKGLSFSQKYRIKPLPLPQPFMGGKTITDFTMPSGILSQCPKVIANAPNSPLNVPYTVTSFSMQTIVNGRLVESSSPNGVMTPQMCNMMKSAKKGDMIWINNIKASSPGMPSRAIGSLAYKVI